MVPKFKIKKEKEGDAISIGSEDDDVMHGRTRRQSSSRRYLYVRVPVRDIMFDARRKH